MESFFLHENKRIPFFLEVLLGGLKGKGENFFVDLETCGSVIFAKTNPPPSKSDGLLTTKEEMFLTIRRTQGISRRLEI